MRGADGRGSWADGTPHRTPPPSLFASGDAFPCARPHVWKMTTSTPINAERDTYVSRSRKSDNFISHFIHRHRPTSYLRWYRWYRTVHVCMHAALPERARCTCAHVCNELTISPKPYDCARVMPPEHALHLPHDRSRCYCGPTACDAARQVIIGLKLTAEPVSACPHLASACSHLASSCFHLMLLCLAFFRLSSPTTHPFVPSPVKRQLDLGRQYPSRGSQRQALYPAFEPEMRGRYGSPSPPSRCSQSAPRASIRLVATCFRVGSTSRT